MVSLACKQARVLGRIRVPPPDSSSPIALLADSLFAALTWDLKVKLLAGFTVPFNNMMFVGLQVIVLAIQVIYYSPR